MKNTFVQGTLEVNQDGATYENIVYDRRLVVRLANGERLHIFDFAEPISTNLLIGEVYEMVIVPFVVKVEFVSEFQLGISPESALWQGKVIDPHWLVAEVSFKIAQLDVYDGEWILIETAFGQMLLSAENIGTAVQKDDVLQWERGRLDLYAVV